MQITMYRKEFFNANCLVAEAGSNCPKGGDAGHGGRTVVTFEDMGGTAMDVIVTNEHGIETSAQASKVTLIFSGDAEHDTAIRGLEFILGVLKKDESILSVADRSKAVDIA
ncbi:MAG: hypothetical protein U1A72_09790 [Sulfuritalea sp.]|nr:hypothetical protein [Sulfuritalea sp.]